MATETAKWNVSTERLVITLLDNLVWPILLVSFLIFAALIPDGFFTGTNIEFLLYGSAALGVIVLGEALCLLSGNFDLSVGANAGFSAMLAAIVMAQIFPGLPGILGIGLILGIGGVIGLLNGVSVVKIGVNPFLQTLAAMIVLDGATVALSTSSIYDLPPTYLFIGEGTISGIPFAILLVMGLYLLAWVALKYTRFGVSIYAVGGSEESAKKAGINAPLVITSVFVLAGMLSALGGLILTGFLGAASPGLATDVSFQAFAAAVIGGISLFGGRGNIIGAFGGVLLLATIEAGLVMMNFPSEFITMVNGLVLLVAIILYTSAENVRERYLSDV